MRRLVAFFLCVSCFIAICACDFQSRKGTDSTNNSVVAYVFVEPLIEAYVRLRLGLTEDAIITKSDLQKITFFDASILDGYEGTIQNLIDLSLFENLETLDLRYCSLDDLSPLGGLTKLRKLSLEECNVTNIEPLRNLTNLEQLDLSKNFNLYNLDALQSLVKLRALSLWYAPSEDWTPLANLASLEYLHIRFSGLVEHAEELQKALSGCEIVYVQPEYTEPPR